MGSSCRLAYTEHCPQSESHRELIAHSQINMLKQVQRTDEQMSTMDFPKMESARCTTTYPSSFSSNTVSLSLHRVDGEPRPKTRLAQTAHHEGVYCVALNLNLQPHLFFLQLRWRAEAEQFFSSLLVKDAQKFAAWRRWQAVLKSSTSARAKCTRFRWRRAAHSAMCVRANCPWHRSRPALQSSMATRAKSTRFALHCSTNSTSFVSAHSVAPRWRSILALHRNRGRRRE